MTAPTALIDGDHAAWHCSFFAGDADLEERIHRWVGRVLTATGAARAIVCFGDPSRHYFRHDLFPGYKNRPHNPPEGLETAKHILRAGYIPRTLPNVEADDVIGILATAPGWDVPKVIVADDKDLLTVPGEHYNPRTGQYAVINPDEAHYNHMFQTLVGDSNDTYPGCPGVGEKRAKLILGRSPEWRRVVDAFAARELDEEAALLQARLARILHAGDFDKGTNTIRLWTPQREVAYAR